MRLRLLLVAALAFAACPLQAQIWAPPGSGLPGPSGSESACLVVERTAAATGETLIAGPFASETGANAALEAAPACTNTSCPCATASRTLAGTRPTRYSWTFTSFGTPMRILPAFHR